MKKIYYPLFAITLFFTACKSDKSPEELLSNGSVKELKDYLSTLKSTNKETEDLIGKFESQIQEKDSTVSISVLTRALKETHLKHFMNIRGEVKTDKAISINAEHGGRLKLYVNDGDYVRKGQLIGKVDDGGLASQKQQAKIRVSQARKQYNQAQTKVKQAEIAADLARITYQKQSSLWKQKIGSEMQYLSARSSYQNAQKSVEVARQYVSIAQEGISIAQQNVSASNSQLEKTIIRAPFSGTVEELKVNNGQTVAPGTQLMYLINLNSMKAVAKIPETYLALIKKGSPVIVEIPTLGKSLSGTISVVGNFVDPLTRSFTIEVPLKNNDHQLKPYAVVNLKLVDYTNPNAIIVPEGLIKEDLEGSYVYIAQNNIAVKKHIQLGRKTDEGIEVLSGLVPHDLLIIKGYNDIQKGSLLETGQKQTTASATTKANISKDTENESK